MKDKRSFVSLGMVLALGTFCGGSPARANEGELLLSETKADTGISAQFEFAGKPELVTRMIDLCKQGVAAEQVHAEAKTLSAFLKFASAQLNLTGDPVFLEAVAKNYVAARAAWLATSGDDGNFAGYFDRVANIEDPGFAQSIQNLSAAQKTLFFYFYPVILSSNARAYRSLDDLVQEVRDVGKRFDTGTGYRLRLLRRGTDVLSTVAAKRIPAAAKSAEKTAPVKPADIELLSLFALQSTPENDGACGSQPTEANEKNFHALLGRLVAIGDSGLTSTAKASLAEGYAEALVDVAALVPAIRSQCLTAADFQSPATLQAAAVRLFGPVTVPDAPAAKAAEPGAPVPAPAKPTARRRDMTWLTKLDAKDPFFEQLRLATAAYWLADPVAKFSGLSRWEGGSYLFVDAEAGEAEWQLYSATDGQWLFLRTKDAPTMGWANISAIEIDAKNTMHVFFSTSSPSEVGPTRDVLARMFDRIPDAAKWLQPVAQPIVLHNPSTKKRDLTRKASKKDFIVSVAEKLPAPLKSYLKTADWKKRSTSTVAGRGKWEKDALQAADEKRKSLIEKWKGRAPKEEVEVAEKLLQGMRRVGYSLEDLKARDLAETFVPLAVPPGAPLIEAETSSLDYVYLIPVEGFTARKNGSVLDGVAVPAYSMVASQPELAGTTRNNSVVNTSGVVQTVYAIHKIAFKQWHKKLVVDTGTAAERLRVLASLREPVATEEETAPAAPGATPAPAPAPTPAAKP